MGGKRVTFTVVLLFVFLATTLSLSALDPNKKITQYSISIWNMEAGLPGNAVYAIRQTRDGYLWLGTEDGLVRFDGIDFEVFNKDNTRQLEDNVIRALYLDQHNTLWIGTNSGGLSWYKNGTFKTPQEYRDLKEIRAIAEDRQGNLWIGTGNGLTCISIKSSEKPFLPRNAQRATRNESHHQSLKSGGEFTTYTKNDDLPHNEVNAIYTDENKDLWVTTTAGIVKIIEPGCFQSYPSLNRISRLHHTGCLYDSATKELWIATGEGLFLSKNGELKSFGIKEGLPHITVNCLFRDRMKNLWIGTDGGGLTRMSGDELSTLPRGDGPGGGSKIYSIYEDREGSLWVGTLDGGLHQLRDSIFTTYTTREGLLHDDTNCTYQVRNGDIYFGSNGGLNRLANGTMTTVLTAGEGPLKNPVRCLYEDADGYLWVGAVGGLHRLKDQKPTTLTGKDGLSNDKITCISGDSRGYTWVGTEDGLNRFDNKTGVFTAFNKKDGLSHKYITFIFQDSRGALLVGTEEGLNRFNDGGFTPITLGVGLEKCKYCCVYEDKNRVLWFGTESGLIRWKEKETTVYTGKHGLMGNYVYSILEDEKGNLWLAGRNGVSRVSKKDLEDFAAGKIDRLRPVWYNERDGMKSRFCTAVGCKTRDGKFWFPTIEGTAMIDPVDIKKSTPAPTPIIKKVLVNGKPVDIFAPLEMGPGIGRLEFYYTGVSFINPKRMSFKIKLDGYDQKWIEMGNDRHTTYTGLSPRKYTFHVKAANAVGEWNETGTSLSFYLKPYFWQTSWFINLTVILVLMFVVLAHQLRVRQLKAREKELAAQVDMRTKDLKERNIELENAQQKIRRSKDLIEAKNIQLESQTVQLREQSEKLSEMDKIKSRFFANISHEFRTPLTLIMGPLEQMPAETDDPKQKKKLNLMLRNSQRLLGLINQLLELSKFESGKVKLNVSRQNVIPYLKGIVANFEPAADQEELDLTFHAETEDIRLFVDIRKLEDIVYNLLINAVKFTPPGGRITVSARQKPGADETGTGFLEITVADTGPGIPRDQLVHIFNRFYQSDSVEFRKEGSGIGLALVKELVQLHQGTIDVHSREGKGTEFIITLPISDEPPEDSVQSDVPVPIREMPVEPDVSTEDEEAEEKSSMGAEAFGADGAPGILVVEDSADVREYIRNSLEPLYTVIEAEGGEEGLKKAREVIPDLIISDVMMPGMDGYELCKALKGDIRTSHIPVILLTAKASEESIVQGLETGTDDYITKPFNTTILLARIKNLIELRRRLHMDIDREMTLQPVEISVAAIDRDFLKELKAVINKNLSDPDFNVDQLAKKLYMDRSTIYRKVLALTGETPTRFIRSCRLKRAAELLRDNFGTVVEVAFEVGFSNAGYFAKCFKEKFHQQPSAFQERE
jgi:signal transduction histidine kinase/ligand-binding sensor domain-containing protein/DNA-binding response OmpR family regulator